MTKIIKRRSEIAEEKVLKILSKYPEGLGFNELYRIYKEKEGEKAVSNLTFAKVIKKLKEEGKIEVEEEGWVKGKKKNIKLSGAIKAYAKILDLCDIFEKYTQDWLKRLNKLAEKEAMEKEFELNRIFSELKCAYKILIYELNGEKERIFGSNYSDKFKKNFLFQAFNIEKELELKLIDTLIECLTIDNEDVKNYAEDEHAKYLYFGDVVFSFRDPLNPQNEVFYSYDEFKEHFDYIFDEVVNKLEKIKKEMGIDYGEEIYEIDESEGLE